MELFRWVKFTLIVFSSILGIPSSPQNEKKKDGHTVALRIAVQEHCGVSGLGQVVHTDAAL